MTLDRPLELHPDVALRPEPFGALAYHYGNRRLVFLKHPDVVAVVRRLGDEPTVRADARGVRRRPVPLGHFVRALSVPRVIGGGA